MLWQTSLPLPKRSAFWRTSTGSRLTKVGLSPPPHLRICGREGPRAASLCSVPGTPGGMEKMKDGYVADHPGDWVPASVTLATRTRCSSTL